MIQKFERVWEALPIEARPQGELEGLGVVEGPMTEAEEREEIQVGEVFPPEIGYKKPPPQTKSFAAETAAITGESKRSINQHLARAEALGDDIDRLVGTSLDKGVEADALIKLPESERKELIERAGVTERKKVLPGAFRPHGSQARRFRVFQTAWVVVYVWPTGTGQRGGVPATPQCFFNGRAGGWPESPECTKEGVAKAKRGNKRGNKTMF